MWRRRLVRSFVATLWVVWAASVAVWWRGLYRADLIGVVLPRHVYVEVETEGGQVHIQAVGHWPAPPAVHRSSGPAVRDLSDWAYSDPLTGPDSRASWVFATPTNVLDWHGLEVSRSQLCFVTGGDGRPLVNVGRRGWDIGSGPEPPATKLLPATSISFPTWAVPITGSIPLAVVLIALCYRRGRQRRRRRRGLCVRCGYDRRQSPERCPECGATAAV